MRRDHVLWCPGRPGKSRHRLAWREVAEHGDLSVVASVAAATTRGMRRVETRFTAEELGDVRMSTMVTCPCGELWNVDLNTVLEGTPPQLRRVPTETSTGVSYNRQRHKGPLR